MRLAVLTAGTMLMLAASAMAQPIIIPLQPQPQRNPPAPPPPSQVPVVPPGQPSARQHAATHAVQPPPSDSEQ